MRVAVTGASGFVGSSLVRHLAGSGSCEVVAIGRRDPGNWQATVRQVNIDDLAANASSDNIEQALHGVDAIIHLAALAQAKGRSSDEMMHGNVAVAEKLARLAINAGVKRLLLVSTAQVSGTVTPGAPIDENSQDDPQDDYGRSKLAAEAAVQRVCSETSTNWTIVRPPLVYGRGAKGAIAQLAKLVANGIPLPFGAVTANRRDLISVGNLVDFLSLATRHPQAVNRTFVVRDGSPLSTRVLVETMADAMQRPARLVQVPPNLLRLLLQSIGATRAIDRLLGDYQIDDARARRELGWAARCSMIDDMKRWLGPSL